MKVLTLSKNDTTVLGYLRVDMLSNSPANITIMQIKNASGAIVDYLSAISGFNQRVPYSWASFVAFCVTNNIRIDAQDSNGTSSANLLLNQAPAGTKYTIVDITSGSKTIRIATDVTASFTAGDHIVIYNPDNTIFGSFTHASDSYSAPNTSIVVVEAITTVAASSGKYLVNNGQ